MGAAFSAVAPIVTHAVPLIASTTSNNSKREGKEARRYEYERILLERERIEYMEKMNSARDEERQQDQNTHQEQLAALQAQADRNGARHEEMLKDLQQQQHAANKERDERHDREREESRKEFARLNKDAADAKADYVRQKAEHEAAQVRFKEHCKKLQEEVNVKVAAAHNEARKEREDANKRHQAETQRIKQEMKEASEEQKKVLFAELAAVKEAQKITVENYDSKMKQQRMEFNGIVKQLPTIAKHATRSTALMGKTCAGKTTLINQLFGTNCKPAPIRNTAGTDCVFNDQGIQVHDCFGNNDEELYTNIEVLVQVKQLHLLVMVYTDSVNDVYNTAEMMSLLDVPILFLRNKSATIVKAGQEELVWENDFKELTERCGDCPIDLLLTDALSGHNLEKAKEILFRGSARVPVIGSSPEPE